MNLIDQVREQPYRGYVYAYPHKTAYRKLEPSIPLKAVWGSESHQSLFMYVHIPFCGMRCGFCNLFTQANPTDSGVDEYLTALEREMTAVHAALPDARFARLAIGGGTPSYLTVRQLEYLFDRLNQIFDVDPLRIPTGIEVSPETVSGEKLAFLRERGVQRVSMGVQSFIERETGQSGRPQKIAQVESALDAIRAAGFPIRNIDLIYGLPEQTMESWAYSLSQALEWQPEELYLYPLYVRPLTGLGRSNRAWDDDRLRCYNIGRDRLLEAGYQQVSMRYFRRMRNESGPAYCCQTDGMVGIGCGARSYTRSLHYSGEYAVSAGGVREILTEYIQRDTEHFSHVRHGYHLDMQEQRRRYVLQSLLNCDEGIDLDFYGHRWRSDLWEDFPLLRELAECDYLIQSAERWFLSEEALAYSDSIGPMLYSPAIEALSSEYQLL